jgi:threonine/homoserine/homoserine lactone efflux protein
MSTASLLSFFFGMFLLSLAPGPGIALVVARALHAGMLASFAVITGLVIGDIFFMILALAGLSVMANTLGLAFKLIKWAGALYLIWLGYKALVAPPRRLVLVDEKNVSAVRELGLGLVVTLGNPKPLLFYGALMPSLLDMSTVTFVDTMVLAIIVAVVSYIVLGGYALLADRLRHLLSSSKALRRLSQSTGLVMIGAGVAVATR